MIDRGASGGWRRGGGTGEELVLVVYVATGINTPKDDNMWKTGLRVEGLSSVLALPFPKSKT